MTKDGVKQDEFQKICFSSFHFLAKHINKEVTQLLQLRQKYFISVTTMKDNTLAQQADYNVYVSSNTFYLNDGTDYSSFISYHIFFETLLRKYNEYKENHELT